MAISGVMRSARASWRTRLAAAVGGLAALGICAIAAATRQWAAVAAAVAVGGAGHLVIARANARLSVVVWPVLGAAVSLVVTAVALSHDPPLPNPNAGWGLLEVAGTLALIALVTRRASSIAGWLALTALVVAQVLWITRFVPTRTTPALVGAAAAWGIGSVAALVAGGYPRFAERRLARGVAAAQARQRRQLERDLHDYVAHDISGIIVQAQAARYVDREDPDRLLAALQRIADSGQKAMESMDRALELLRDDADLADAGPLRGQPTLLEAQELLTSFRESAPARLEYQVTGDVAELPRIVSATLFRVLVEALTNVRRHAPSARQVRVSISTDRAQATLLVANDGASTPAYHRDSRGSGTGIRFLQARVEALGGHLETQRRDDEWRLSVCVPLT